jgi:hypothetical protein
MTLPKTLVDREHQKFRDTSVINQTKVAVEIENANSIPVSFIEAQPTDFVIEYQESTSVVASNLVTVLEYIVPTTKTLRIKSILLSGTNVAEFYLVIDNIVKGKFRTWWGEFNTDLMLDISFAQNTNIKVKAEHDRPDLCEFSATIKGYLS